VSFTVTGRQPSQTIHRQLKTHSIFIPSLLGALLLTSFLLTGCKRPEGKVLGQTPDGSVRTILAVQAGDTPPTVVVAGRLVEKCPTAGCWFRLQDETGTIKVDTKAAGFVITDIPLERQVTVAGKVVQDANEVTLEAAGVRY
jgi:uncharacterized protein YdeI (BOF family)